MTALAMLEFHKDWAWVMILTNAAVGVWALAAHQWRAFRRAALWWSIGVAELTVFVQAVLGVIVVNRYDIEVPQMHALYGFSGIIAVGIIYSYRNQMHHRLYLLYGLGSLFIMGLGIRAMVLD
jgi:hypothetical protein